MVAQDFVAFRVIVEKKFSNFPDRLKGCMSKMGLNQVDLSKKIKVSQTVISALLRGRNEPNLPMLLKLSQYFQISLFCKNL